jgi:hypothetical protein
MVLPFYFKRFYQCVIFFVRAKRRGFLLNRPFLHAHTQQKQRAQALHADHADQRKNIHHINAFILIMHHFLDK